MRTSFVTLFASGLAVAVAQDLTMSALPMPVQQISDGQVQNAAAPTVISISAVGGSMGPPAVGAAGATESGTSAPSAAAAAGGLVVASPEGTPVPTFTMSALPMGSSAQAAGQGSAGNSSGGSSAAAAGGSSATAVAGSSTANLLGAAGASSTSTGVAQVSTAGAAPMATAAGIGFVGIVAALVI